MLSSSINNPINFLFLFAFYIAIKYNVFCLLLFY